MLKICIKIFYCYNYLKDEYIYVKFIATWNMNIYNIKIFDTTSKYKKKYFYKYL